MHRSPAKVLALVLVPIIGLCSAAQAEAHAWVGSATTRQTGIRSKVEQLGLGAQVKLTAFDGRHYRGYITDVTDRSIEVTDGKTLRARSFDFSSIERIQGRPLPDPWDPIRNRFVRAIFRTTSQVGFGP